jgi:hypothetical protein
MCPAWSVPRSQVSWPWLFALASAVFLVAPECFSLRKGLRSPPESHPGNHYLSVPLLALTPLLPKDGEAWGTWSLSLKCGSRWVLPSYGRSILDGERWGPAGIQLPLTCAQAAEYKGFPPGCVTEPGCSPCPCLGQDHQVEMWVRPREHLACPS